MAIKVLPIEFYILPEGVFVVESDANNKDLIGGTIDQHQKDAGRLSIDSASEIFTQTTVGWKSSGWGWLFRPLALELKGLGIASHME